MDSSSTSTLSSGQRLSVATPLLAFLPVFSLALAYLLFGEVPSQLGALGALTIVVGAYLLHVKLPLREHALVPFKQIFTDRACSCILLAALIGAILLVGQRYGVRHSSPVTFFTLTLVIDWLLFLGLVSSILIGTGIAWAVGLTCLCASYNYTLAVYAGSAMQVQTLISITLGALLFKEERYAQRIAAGVVIIAGVIMTSWAVGT